MQKTKDFINANNAIIPSIIIGIALMPLIFTIFIPIIGGIIALFALIKSLVFALLGFDDNDDFLFIFKFVFTFIYEFVINIFSKKVSFKLK